jgi:GntR family transcriptional regulator, histidine utilization repressor
VTLPLHERIRTDIEGQILSGALNPGDHIPIEHELMRIYSCARMTLNKAITALAAAGLVERRKRLGTLVAKPRVHSMILDVPDLVGEVAARKHVYRWALTVRRIRQPKRSDAIEQELARGGKLLEVSGLHFASEEALAVETRLISLVSVPEIADELFDDQSPGTWLLDNVPWTEAETRISAVGADADIAKGLCVPEGQPCLSIERRTWRGTDPVTRVRQIFEGRQYDLVARFGHNDSRKRDNR